MVMQDCMFHMSADGEGLYLLTELYSKPHCVDWCIEKSAYGSREN